MLRIVVQCVQDAQDCKYRLIAYGNGQTYQPVNFESFPDVCQALQLAVPSFDVKAFLLGDGNDTTIVLAGTVELDGEQLSILGLK